MSKIKVLALVPDSVEKPSGGLGEQFRNIRNCLLNDLDYYICAYPEQNNIPNYKQVISPIPRFKHQSLTTIYGQSMYFLKALEFNQEFDVIHTFDWSTFYAGVLCSWHFKKPLVSTVQLSLEQLNKSGIFYCHDYNSIDGKCVNDLQVFFEHFGLFYANKIIHVSEYYSSFYPQYQNKSIVIQNGIDVKSWVQKRKPNLPGKNKIKLCYIGRASPMKGLQTILNAVIPEDVDFYFIVSPKNAEEPWFTGIKQKCNNVNIFHILGLYGQDKIDMLFEMDGVVMPSIHEPFGIVALEALISKNILFTTANGGIGEIVKGLDYFKIDSPSTFENAIAEYKKLITAPEKLLNILDSYQERAKKFDWNNIAKKVYNVYKDVKTETYIPNTENIPDYTVQEASTALASCTVSSNEKGAISQDV